MYKSSNFRPNNSGLLKRAEGHTVNGRTQLGEAKKIRLTVIRFETDIVSTSIRADKSGSKSRAQEQVNVGRILIDPKVEFAVGDSLEIEGTKWKIDSKFPRFDQAGRLHHYQADLTSWV